MNVVSNWRSSFQLVLAASAAVAVTASVTIWAQAPAAQGQARRPQEDMTAMGRGFRTLGSQIADKTKNDSSLALVAEMEQSSVSAKDAVPPLVAALPDAERGARLVAYKKEMVKLIRQELDLEDQLLDGDNAKAAESVAALNATMQEGHMGFRPARGRGPGGPGRGPGGPGGGQPPAGRQ
jgi:hypothetical protein